MIERTKVCTFASMLFPHQSTAPEIVPQHRRSLLRHATCAPHTSDTLSHVWHFNSVTVNPDPSLCYSKQYGKIQCLCHLPERKRARCYRWEWQHILMERLLTGLVIWGTFHLQWRCYTGTHCASLQLRYAAVHSDGYYNSEVQRISLSHLTWKKKTHTEVGISTYINYFTCLKRLSAYIEGKSHSE